MTPGHQCVGGDGEHVAGAGATSAQSSPLPNTAVRLRRLKKRSISSNSVIANAAGGSGGGIQRRPRVGAAATSSARSSGASLSSTPIDPFVAVGAAKGLGQFHGFIDCHTIRNVEPLPKLPGANPG